MGQQSLKSRSAQQILGGIVAVAGFSFLGLLPAEASSVDLAGMRAQLKDAQSQLERITTPRTMLAFSTSTVQAPTMPVCRITFDKAVYKFGETMKLSWTSTGAQSIEFVQDTSGKETLTLPADVSLAAKGSATILASVIGSPSVFMKVKSVSGHESVCGHSFTIVDEKAGKKDARISKLQTKIINLVRQANKLQGQLATLNERINTNLIEQIKTQIQIDQIVNATSTPKTGGKVHIDSSSFEVTDTHYATTSGTGKDYVEYKMTFEVVGADTRAYIPMSAVRNGTGAAKAGLVFQIVDESSSANSNAKGNVSAVLTSTAHEESGYFEVGEGESESFTATIAFDPTVTGTYRAELVRLNWTDTMTVNQGDIVTPGKLKSFKFTPAADFSSNKVVVEG